MFNPDYRQNVDNFVKGRLEIFHDTWYDDVSVKIYFWHSHHMIEGSKKVTVHSRVCLLYTSDAADE